MDDRRQQKEFIILYRVVHTLLDKLASKNDVAKRKLSRVKM